MGNGRPSPSACKRVRFHLVSTNLPSCCIFMSARSAVAPGKMRSWVWIGWLGDVHKRRVALSSDTETASQKQKRRRTAVHNRLKRRTCNRAPQVPSLFGDGPTSNIQDHRTRAFSSSSNRDIPQLHSLTARALRCDLNQIIPCVLRSPSH